MTLRPSRRSEHSTRRTREREIRQERGPWPTYDHAAHVRRLPCACKGLAPTEIAKQTKCWGRVEANHVIRRSQGGEWSDLVPLCQAHHPRYDVDCSADPKMFQRIYGPDLRLLADALATQARAKNGKETE